MSLEIDHLLLCVTNLDEASDEMFHDHGLASVAGGRHAGHGTANRIVPLGRAYLELVTVVDPIEAETSSFGMWVAERAGSRPAVDGLCLRTDDLGSVCDRLGLAAVPMSRRTPGGEDLAWSVAGMAEALPQSLPFFIEWDVAPHLHPGATPADHSVAPGSIEVKLSGEAESLRRWVTEVPYVTLNSGTPGVEATIETSAGPIRL